MGLKSKSLTGNLDASDGEKIFKILNQLQNNQATLQQQLSQQYSINDQIIDIFDKTIKNIQHNEIVLTSKIMQLYVIIKEQITIFFCQIYF